MLALIEHEGRLLFDLRADAPVWALVGGAVELDETLAGASRREVLEETGLVIARYSDVSRSSSVQTPLGAGRPAVYVMRVGRKRLRLRTQRT